MKNEYDSMVMSSYIRISVLIALFLAMWLWIVIVLVMPRYHGYSYLLLILAFPLGFLSGYIAGHTSSFKKFLSGFAGSFIGTILAMLFLFTLTNVTYIAPIDGLLFSFTSGDIFVATTFGILFGPLTGLFTGIGSTIIKPKRYKTKEEERGLGKEVEQEK
ncbi:MAG: hypothetical protein ACTSX9_07735 [Candidatus Njordarchaeales archaeon]